MCGITGIIAFNEVGRIHMIHLVNATKALEKRGPDSQGTFVGDRVGLGHRRLSIQDTSYNGHQPMKDPSERYTIVFNGEIYNYRSLREELINKGHTFNSGSDTEVLLRLYIVEGENFIHKLHGFWAFAIHDKETNKVFIARDRYGIKPLYFYHDEDKFVFASELKSLMIYNIPKKIDYNSLQQYFQYNYIPAPNSIFQNVKKLLPGHQIEIDGKKVTEKAYYTLPDLKTLEKQTLSYSDLEAELRKRLIHSVQERLVADVPLGCFLSGGIDSSIIATIASKYAPNLETFSVGFSDNPFFDETKYALAVAKKNNTKHTVFSLSQKDIYDQLYDVLDYLDEPFADSSSLPVYILCKKTSQNMKVALSGDGADEIFAGYNKYLGEYKIRHPKSVEKLIAKMGGIWKSLPKSRNDKFSNTIRQLDKFSSGFNMSETERYIRWCSYMSATDSLSLFSKNALLNYSESEDKSRTADIIKHFKGETDINTILRSDIDMVLQNDMLTKVDMMSMANGLEVRVPFLEKDVLEFAMGIPEKYKINHGMKKKILQEAFRKDLPDEIFNRPKHGFEVPLLDWFRGDLRHKIENEVLSDSFIEEQGIFNLDEIRKLKQKLFSSNPEDTHATVWALIVFQHWWKKYMK